MVDLELAGTLTWPTTSLAPGLFPLPWLRAGRNEPGDEASSNPNSFLYEKEPGHKASQQL